MRTSRTSPSCRKQADGGTHAATPPGHEALSRSIASGTNLINKYNQEAVLVATHSSRLRGKRIDLYLPRYVCVASRKILKMYATTFTSFRFTNSEHN